MTETMTNDIINALRVAACASMIASLGWRIATSQNVQLRDIMHIFLLTLFCAYYGDILQWGSRAFDGLVTNVSGDNAFLKIMKLETEKVKSWRDFENLVAAFLWSAFRMFGYAGRWLGDNIRVFLVILVKVSAPLIIAMGAWRIFENLIGKLIATTVWISAWSLSYLLADMAIGSILESSLGKITAGALGGFVVGSGVALGLPAVLFIGLVIFLFTAIFYTLAPVMLYKLIMGGDLCTPMLDAMKTAAITSIGMAKSAVAGTTKMAGMIDQAAAAKVSKNNEPGHSGGSSGTGSSAAPQPTAPQNQSIDPTAHIAGELQKNIAKQAEMLKTTQGGK